MKHPLPEKLYYSIGEVAKAFEVNTSLLRFWEKEFDILKPKKNKKGNRYFTTKDIKHLEKIFFLVKEKGYTLEGAKEELQGNQKLENCIQMIKRLEYVKSQLLEIKNKLDVSED